jgi:hypothetical protein
MIRKPHPRRGRRSPSVEELIRLARSMAQSSSRLEDGFWEARLLQQIAKLIKSDDDEALNVALDTLYATEGRACDALADLIEFCCESHAASGPSDHDVLLFAAPVLAWSRYLIHSGAIPAETLANLGVQLKAHVFAADVRVGLANVLFSPDQLPQSYSATARLAEKLLKSALHGRDLHIDPAQLGETVNFLSDTRYIVGVVAAAKGAPLFRWQEGDGDDSMRNAALKDWRNQGGAALRPALPACAYELLLPMAYHAASRDADRLSRPYSIRASVAFLGDAINIDASSLCAVIARFQDSKTEEYRIGFVHRDTGDVVHGVVWPLLDAIEYGKDSPAEATPDTAMQIEAVLRDCGIGDIKLLEQLFPLEYCDDCGAPLYPNREGEPMHAELPDDGSTQSPQQLH